MRLVVLLPVLISVAVPAYADGVRENRYGPVSPRQADVRAAAAYDGPTLGWAGKRAATANATPVQSSLGRPVPTPVAAWAGYQPTQAVPTPPPFKQVSTSAAPLPTSLYAAPTPPPALPSATPPAARVAALSNGAPGARFYSVDRAYGLTPDAIPPVAPDNRVLISASDPSPEAKSDTPAHGSMDWLAAGVAGDDSSADTERARKAKTRDETQ